MRLDGTRTLSDLESELKASQAWFLKTEKYYGFHWASGTPGLKSAYTLERCEFFRRNLFLRSYDFTLEEIKALYNVEKQIEEYVDKYYPEDDDVATEDIKVYLNIFNGEKIRYNTSKYNPDLKKRLKEAVGLDDLLTKHRNYIMNIMKVIREFNENRKKDEEKIEALIK